VGAGLLVAVVGGPVLAFLLAIYPLRGFTVPIGWDASEYLWRTRLAQHEGVAEIATPLPSIATPKSGRPGYPVVAAAVSSALQSSPFRVTMVMASVLAVAVGLGAGAFVAGILRRPWWQFAAVAVAVALSPSVIGLMKPEGYLDTMLAAAVLVTAGIPIAASIEDRGALLPAIVLLGTGAVIHWSFFILLVGTLGLCAVAYAPSSWKAWRAGRSLWDTTTLRMGGIAAGGAVLGSGLLFVVLGNGLPKNRVDVSEFAKKLRRDLPKYKFPVTLPLAALGVASLVPESRRGGRWGDRARFVLTFLLAWCGVVLAGYLARTVFHLPVAAHRFLSFALAVPILGILGVLWVADAVGRVAKPLAVGVVVVAVAAAGWLGYREWFFSTKPFTDATQYRQAALVGSYLDAAHVPEDQPFVVIVGSKDWNTVGLVGHILRAGMPPERVPEMYVYVGAAQTYLAKRPIDTPQSRAYFQRIRPVYSADPPAVILASFDPGFYGDWVGQHPASEMTGGLAVVHGPPPPSGLRASGPRVGPIPWWKLGFLGLGCLVVLAVSGLGWSFAMLRRWVRPVEVLAAAPAVGIAMLAVLGIVADRLGVRLIGAGGVLTFLATAGLGGLVALLGARRGWTAPPPQIGSARGAAATT
jgi:hypothetical protein